MKKPTRDPKKISSDPQHWSEHLIIMIEDGNLCPFEYGQRLYATSYTFGYSEINLDLTQLVRYLSTHLTIVLRKLISLQDCPFNLCSFAERGGHSGAERASDGDLSGYSER